MQPHYLYLHIPRRGLLYISIGVWLMVIYTLARGGVSPVIIALICAFLILSSWRALRDRPAGMEIADGEWRFFVGKRRWSVPLGQIDAVRVLGTREAPAGLALKLRDGEVQVLPAVLAPRIGPLARELDRRGIPIEE